LEFSWKPGDCEPIQHWLADNKKATDHRKDRKERPAKRVQCMKNIKKAQEDLQKIVEPTKAKIELATTRRKEIEKEIKSLKIEIKKSDENLDLNRQSAELKKEKKALPKALTDKARR
jgi:chromosome segregation ATPase